MSDALSAKTFGSFRASVKIVGSQYGGITFWSQSGSINYRVFAAFGNVYLTGPFPTQSTSMSGGTFTLTVDADSTTREIKIYRNGSLVLSYTDTNTSNPNSGKVGPNGRYSADLDNFIVVGR